MLLLVHVMYTKSLNRTITCPPCINTYTTYPWNWFNNYFYKCLRIMLSKFTEFLQLETIRMRY